MVERLSKKRVLFIDRDGTLIEEPADEQVDSFGKLRFKQNVFTALSRICELKDYELVMVTNQDGLGTASFPEETFWPVHNLMLQALGSQGITFHEQLIDRHFPSDNAPTRKPATGMVSKYMLDLDYDMSHSYVIGDRDTDAQLAANMGCRALILGRDGMDWNRVADIVVGEDRRAEVHRVTNETDIFVSIDLDGHGQTDISTGLGFFDHMLGQIGRHGGMALTIRAKGDLHVDEHHTVEDTALALGQCLLKALGSKRGIERYGYTLPMDDCLCTVALDFGGRPWLNWHADFRRERIGDVPTELFFHFFKSLSDAALMNLYIEARGDNEHHKIESIFKALARSLKMAVKRDILHYELPTTKGTL